MISSKWNCIQLADVCEFQKGYAFKSVDYQKKGRKIVKVTDLNNYSVNIEECICIDENKADDYLRYSLKKDDVIITTVGSWPSNPNSVVGKVVIVPKDAEGALLNQNAVRVRAKNKSIQKFVFYTLRNKAFFDHIIGTAQGAANQASITQNDIKKFQFLLPPLLEQKCIAEILSSLDDKIELNNRMNKTLEEIAQTMFKRWFVDFEFPDENGNPYKSSGGKMIESELGMVPEGWQLCLLGDLIKRNKEKMSNYEEWKGEDLIDLSNMPRFSICIDEFDKGDKLTTNIYKLHKYDILFGSIRSYFGKAGFSAIDGVITGTVYSFSPNTVEAYSYILMLISSRNFIDYTVAVSSGTKMPIVNWEVFCKYICSYPKQIDTLLAFNNLVFPLIKEIANNILQKVYLVDIRDSLLPKLMSGEIRVPIAEE